MGRTIERKPRDPYMLARLTRLFPVWAVVLSLTAFTYPSWFFDWAPAIPWLLGIVMLGMGLTLDPTSFLVVWRRPRSVVLGLALQYSMMPLIAWGIAALLRLPVDLTAGLVLVGSCPGGTASNVITYLAGGAVALSITLTAISTAISAVATPALTWILVGQSVPVPVASMLRDIVVIVLVPVGLGLLANRLAGARLESFRRGAPLVSVLAIAVIIAVIVARNHDTLGSVGPMVVLAVALHNMLGLFAGYTGGRLSGLGEAECRTLAIEVGMQNSGLGVVLASRYFSALAALPGAVFSVWHNLSGSLLAWWWSGSETTRRRDVGRLE